MKQENKRNLSKEKILNSAILEFSTKTYDNASLNNICNDNNISKGLIYHYFDNKDSLYLSCIEKCFTDFSFYLSQKLKNIEYSKILSSHLIFRQEFFDQNKDLGAIFFNTILHPPKHLEQEINKLRIPFDTINMNSYKNFISTLELREHILPDEAVKFFCMFQEIFNSYFAKKHYDESDYSSAVKDHELDLPKLLDILLHGIVKERTM